MQGQRKARDMPANARISVVDDEDSSREAIAGLVRSFGYDVAEFASAEAFLAADERASTAVVVADLRMPGMTGLELRRRLVKLGSVTPVILVTAYPDMSSRARALNAGVKGYLVKPLAPEELLDCINSALLGSEDAADWGAVGDREEN